MNNQLLEKLIENFSIYYSNPLLDRKVTKSLSKSYLKLLNTISRDAKNNTTLRHTVLTSIRNNCKIEPEGHKIINEDISEVLTDFYQNKINKLNKENIDKQLEVFFVRRWKEFNIDTTFKPNLSPEIARALLNLNENKKLDILNKDVILWSDIKYLTLLKDLWNENNINLSSDRNLLNDISVKIKPDIEKWLLDISYNVIINNDIELEGEFDRNCKSLIKIGSISEACFGICISILNSLFVKSDFNEALKKFICYFVENIKLASESTISILYPTHLSNLVILLDIHLEELPVSVRNEYIQNMLKYLKILHEDSEHDFIMLLSHFPQWFNIYFSE